MFTTFLDEKYGQADGGFIRKIWELSLQNDIDNEPNFLDSILALISKAAKPVATAEEVPRE